MAIGPGQGVDHARGFAQIFGLDPRVAALTFIVDAMLFGGTVATGGLLLPVAVGAGCLLGFITYRAQRRWYGDDADAALIKACIIGLLTAIPTPLPAVLYVPSAILGALQLARARWTRRWRSKLVGNQSGKSTGS